MRWRCRATFLESTSGARSTIVGKALFGFLPWTTFARISYGGNHRVRTLALRRALQGSGLRLTWESLRDIEAVLSAQSAKLYHMGIRTP